ncbi:MAG: flagellar basal-body rod protein FlgG [Lentisphaeraceae bacterium]|nr:flagellar basal-body rod protein FlgG [Lentisphaeraceae bacterium]
MDRALWISATGMEGQTRLTENIANNLANVNTTAYKKGQVHFQDLYYQTVSSVGAATTDSVTPVGVDIGTGSRVSSITRDFSDGTLERKGGELSMAISGEGFFEILLPDGSLSYTRDGHFHRDQNGQIVNDNGYRLNGSPTIDPNATQIDITSGGVISQTVNGEVTNLGNLTLTRFPNSEGLKPIGNNLFSQTEASGNAINGAPNQNGYGALNQGFLEASNVEVVKEMVNMIAAQRAYEVISKSIKTSDEMLRTATNLK